MIDIIKLESTMEGGDASLEISLFEYGLIWKYLDHAKEYVLCWGTEMDVDECTGEEYYHKFDWGVYDLDELFDDIFKTDGFYEYIGFDSNDGEYEFDIYGLQSLISYYGILNVFGTPNSGDIEDFIAWMDEL